MKPQRIQRKRVKGWNMQMSAPNSLPVVSVTRPGKWGNPFRVGFYYSISPFGWLCTTAEYATANYTHCVTNLDCVSLYRRYLSQLKEKPNFSELHGKNLACFCKEGDPCHGDVLLALANP